MDKLIAKIKYISVHLRHQYLLSLALFLTTLIVSGCSSSNSKESQEFPDLPIKDNLVLHLKANTGVAVEDGIVTGWIDNSLLGNNLLGAGDPSLIAHSLNGQPTIYFDGEGDKLEHTLDLQGLPTGNNDRTVFMVAKYNSNGFGGFAYGKPINNSTFGLVVDSEGYLAVQGWGKDNDLLTKVDGNGSNWLTQSAKLEAGILTQYKDGIQLNSIAHHYNTTAEQLVVGAEIGNRTYVEMEVAEIIVFDEALNETKRKQVESYLQQKYFL